MNTDDRLRELYTEVFDEVHTSDDLLRKVRNMTENKANRKVRTALKVAYVMASVAVVLVAGNVIAYASTGEPLIKVFFNGEEQNVSASEEDGVYKWQYSDKEGYTYDVYIQEDSDVERNVYIEDTDGAIIVSDESGSSGELNLTITDGIEEITDTRTLNTADMTEEDGKIYLNVGDLKIDITEYIQKDGTAKGTFESDGIVYGYTAKSDGSVSIFIADDENSVSNKDIQEITQENGRTYLTIGDLKIDITEDYKDGTAEGSFGSDGVKFNYSVDSDGNISVSVQGYKEGMDTGIFKVEGTEYMYIIDSERTISIVRAE